MSAAPGPTALDSSQTVESTSAVPNVLFCT